MDSRLLRTVEDLNVCHYELQFIPGKDNCLADSLSRALELNDLIEAEEAGFVVNKDKQYNAAPGNADSLFLCLSLVLLDSVDHNLHIRKGNGYNCDTDTTRS